MAVWCTTLPAAMHHLCGSSAPFRRWRCTIIRGQVALLGRHMQQETGKILSTVPSTAQSSIKNIAKSGDTLFGKLRPYLRKYAFAQKTMACSSEIWALIPSDAVLPKFLFYLVQTEQFLRVANISSGTKMPRAEWSNIEKTEFFIPDPFVQRKVVSLLEGLDQKITFADSALFSLNRLKASLMQQLFI